MRLPTIHGLIRRRLLVNFRVDAEVMRRFLPPPFRPKLHQGYAIAGICLIRLEQMRPAGLPRFCGLSSENAAHRTVAFRATNHTEQPIARTLHVIVGVGTPAGQESPPSYSEFARAPVSVSLAPKESRNFSCKFPLTDRPLPNTVQVEIAPTVASVP